jgi:hypothetical protein
MNGGVPYVQRLDTDPGRNIIHTHTASVHPVPDSATLTRP